MRRILTVALFHPPIGADYPAPKTLGDLASYGHNIQRTMRLLAESTAEQRNTGRSAIFLGP